LMKQLPAILICLLIACNSADKHTGNSITPASVIQGIHYKDGGSLQTDTGAAGKPPAGRRLAYHPEFSLPVGATYEYTVETQNQSTAKTEIKKVIASTGMRLVVQFTVQHADSGRYIFDIAYKKIGIDIKSTDEEDEHYDSENTGS